MAKEKKEKNEEETETSEAEETKTKAKKVDLSVMVNGQKAERARKAVYGGAKPGTAELVLAGRFKGEGYKGDELVLKVYEGLGGLLNAKKAAVNRANEKKEAARKASR